jgi:two-component system, NarL family, sensor kinase
MYFLVTRMVLFLISISLSAPMFGQISPIADSLINLHDTDTARLRILSQWIQANAPNMRDQVLAVADKAIQLSEKTALPCCMATAYYDRGTTLFFQEKIVLAQEAFERCMTHANTCGETDVVIKANRGMVRCLFSKGEYPAALVYVQRMESLLPQATDKMSASICFALFCQIYSSMNRWDEVEQAARRCIQFAVTHDLKRPRTSAFYHLGKSFEMKGQLDSALHYIELARRGYEVINHAEELAGMTMHLARLYAKQGQPAKAEIQMEKAMQIVEEHRDTAGIAFVSMEKGNLLMQNQKLDAAERSLKRSEALFLKINMKPYTKDIYKALSDLYERQGKADLALIYHKKYTEIADVIIGENTRKQIAELEARYENSKKEQEISLLQRQNNIQRLQIGLLAALIALIGLGIFYAVQMVRLQRRKEQERQQISWAKAVVEATEEERRRIAADLHDGIGQQIAAVKMMSASLLTHLPPQQRILGEQLAAQLNVTAQEVRQISHEMMPRSLNDLGLPAALEDLFWLSFPQPPFQLQLDTNQYQLPAHPARDTALYRIAQEAVNNILKHADANQITLKLGVAEQNIYLRISDNGKGHKDIAASGLGIKNMTSRVNMNGGHLKLSTTPHSGTTLNITIPLLEQ